MENLNDLKVLLNDVTLNHVEGLIAEKLGCEIYKDNIPLLTGFVEKEVDASMISITDIESFIKTNSDRIVEFAEKFWGKGKPQSLSIGIAITYSIYLIYLIDKDEKRLLEYLKKRRIPAANNLVKQLLSIKKEMDL